MKFVALYRASFALMLTLATLILSIDATPFNRFSLLYPLAVAAAGVLSILTVDRHPKSGLTLATAKYLSMVSFGLATFEFVIDPDSLVLELGHWLVYLQLIKMFRPKTVEDDWFLFLLALVQVLIGVFLSQSDEVGILLAAWSLTSLWTLGLFHLQREALRAVPEYGITVLPTPDNREPYPGLVDRAFLFSAVRLAVATLALGGGIFLIMPRWSAHGGTHTGGGAPRHLTGFSDRVTLGQMGEILENDRIVMSIELYDVNNRRVEPPPDTLWRGVALTNYRDRNWSRLVSSISGGIDVESRLPGASQASKIYRQQIKLEPTDSNVLFAMRPILRAKTAAGNELSLNEYDGTLSLRDNREMEDDGKPSPRSGPFDYQILSAADGQPLQPGEIFPSQARLRALGNVPTDMLTRLRVIAEAKVIGVAAGQPAERARLLERWLRDSGEFSYTLRMSVVDPSIDPVLDFLENRKQGHCEYYASALTLLLRSIGIPARLVNGFKGGDWNALGRVLHVREKHAHSWVEALVSRDEFAPPEWITLDPTPSRERDDAVAQVGGVSTRIRPLSDYIRYLWVFYVVGFDRERQERAIYDPIRQLMREAGKGFALMGRGLKSAARSLLRFEKLGDFFSIRGFFVSFFALLVVVGSGRLAWWLARRVIRRIRGDGLNGGALAGGVAFYYRLARLLQDIGLERPPSETPREFARRAAVMLAARGPDTLATTDVPPLIVDAFYCMRFGHRELSHESLRHLESRLDALEASIRPAATRSVAH